MATSWLRYKILARRSLIGTALLTHSTLAGEYWSLCPPAAGSAGCEVPSFTPNASPQSVPAGTCVLSYDGTKDQAAYLLMQVWDEVGGRNVDPPCRHAALVCRHARLSPLGSLLEAPRQLRTKLHTCLALPRACRWGSAVAFEGGRWNVSTTGPAPGELGSCPLWAARSAAGMLQPLWSRLDTSCGGKRSSRNELRHGY